MNRFSFTKNLQIKPLGFNQQHLWDNNNNLLDQNPPLSKINDKPFTMNYKQNTPQSEAIFKRVNNLAEQFSRFTLDVDLQKEKGYFGIELPLNKLGRNKR